MESNENNRCRICGLDQEEPLLGSNGDSPLYFICDCCGSESGNDDDSVKACRDYRKNWIAKGALWCSPKNKPSGWSLEAQMKQIPSKFL